MKIKLFLHFGGFVFLLALQAAAAGSNSLALIPWPQMVTLQSGSFGITPDTSIQADSTSHDTAKFLADRLHLSTGYSLKIHSISGSNAGPANRVQLIIRDSPANLNPEGYELNVTTNSVIISASTQAGLFYGSMTFLQLLPAEIFSTTLVHDVAWQAPCVKIQDWPRFKWRGLMLDVSRHFFSKSEVEAVLDAMALQKLNVFHWHLTDDQGWRIEIKKYPKLTGIGAWRSEGGFGFAADTSTAFGKEGRYGGYYTAADIREVVKYASVRHIDIVPEIEMPGHATAALAAYPQYGCSNGLFTIPLTNGVFNGIYNPANEETFKFLDDVLAEVFKLFPGKYVHLGGDEVGKETWENNADCQALMKREGITNAVQLQGWFMRRMEKFVSAHGKTMIGWSEIVKGGLPSHAAVMDWIGGAKEAAGSGHDVVMSPTAYCYLDFYQSTNHAIEPRAAAWGKPLNAYKLYGYDPMPGDLPTILQSRILGAQGNLWTEWVPNLKHAEYMIFPRECALAEITWSDASTKNWNDFEQRLQVHEKRMDEMGINYRHGD